MTEHQRPLLRVVKGNPDETELAVLTAMVAALASAPRATETEPRPRSSWADRARLHRPALRPGPGAWRASGWPS